MKKWKYLKFQDFGPHFQNIGNDFFDRLKKTGYIFYTFFTTVQFSLQSQPHIFGFQQSEHQLGDLVKQKSQATALMHKTYFT